MPTHARSCTRSHAHAALPPLAQSPERMTCILFALWRTEARSTAPVCARKARAWWFMGKGHSVQGDEQEAKFNKELQSDLGTGGKAQMAPSPFQKTSG